MFIITARLSIEFLVWMFPIGYNLPPVNCRSHRFPTFVPKAQHQNPDWPNWKFDLECLHQNCHSIKSIPSPIYPYNWTTAMKFTQTTFHPTGHLHTSPFSSWLPCRKNIPSNRQIRAWKCYHHCSILGQAQLTFVSKCNLININGIWLMSVTN